MKEPIMTKEKLEDMLVFYKTLASLRPFFTKESEEESKENIEPKAKEKYWET